MLDPGPEERDPPQVAASTPPRAERSGAHALDLDAPAHAPSGAPPTSYPPVTHRSQRRPRESTESQGSPGKAILWALALLFVLNRGCQGCSRDESDPWEDGSPRPPAPGRPPTSDPQRLNQPLTPAEQSRLDTLRRDHENGEPLTAAEQRERLELERRASRTRRPR